MIFENLSKGQRVMANLRRAGSWLILGTVAVGLLGASDDDYGRSNSWPMFGQNPANTSSNDYETGLSAKTVGALKLKWTVATGGDVSARAAVADGVVYFPDWGGNLWAVDASRGKVLWSHQLSFYGLATGTASRTTPAIANGVLYLGTQYVAGGPTGWLLAIDAYSGKLLWKTQPDTSNSFPAITASPVVAHGMVFVGMTSNEEFAAASPTYKCCTVRGSLVAVDAWTGKKLWQTFTVPAGYSGGSIWGSSPVVDEQRNTVYAGTGNNYSIPTDPAFVSCMAAGETMAQCLSPDDHVDSIVAFDMTTGSIKWAKKLTTWSQKGVTDGSDSWNVGCFISPFTNCPKPTGPDYDFGSGPNEISYKTSSGTKTIIGAGQKSGIYYALDPDTGAELWHTQVGPGSSLGGMEWGAASDDKRIYVQVGNYYGIPYAYGSAGSWAALDPATGAILWQVADPNGAVDLGAVAVANGVVYAGSMSGKSAAPTMLALDATTGKTLWSFASGSSVNSGASIVNGMVYWGTGYSKLGIPGFTGGTNKFYGFGTSGDDH